ncbi:MAG: hypothetical protein BA066_00790 [Candidatus Korarchaeota archaeon NZ13-K]|nr:MAG: hypothetical protein BA066_00790 [Candidatus Korarchaeota archaeon NZ13-K]
MARVLITLRIRFEDEAEAEEFFKSFFPDFSDLKPKLLGRDVVVRVEERTARARAIANSVLRMVSLFEGISELLRT